MSASGRSVVRRGAMRLKIGAPDARRQTAAVRHDNHAEPPYARGPAGEAKMSQHRARMWAAGALVALTTLHGMTVSAVGASSVPAEARAQLVPTGKLRVAILTYDPALGSREAGGAPGGVEGELARMLAERLDVPLQPVFYDLPSGYASSIGALAWDIAF